MWKPDLSFLRGRYRTVEFDVGCHPWLAPTKERLPGKLEHIGLLVIVSNFTEGFGYERKYPVIYPLLSQPVVESCLKIPSWMWCRGGVNRAVARDAFRNRLPSEIIERTTKGSFDRLAIELIEQQGREIEDLDSLTALKLDSPVFAAFSNDAVHFDHAFLVNQVEN